MVSPEYCQFAYKHQGSDDPSLRSSSWRCPQKSPSPPRASVGPHGYHSNTKNNHNEPCKSEFIVSAAHDDDVDQENFGNYNHFK